MRIGLLAMVALLIVAGFVAYMCSYTVKFTDAAVVTTFGKADADDVITTPGLRFKWPAPIQQTTVYDTRARFLSTRLETQQTSDGRQIVAESFMTWRVSDPLAFYQRFRGSGGAAAREHYTKAEETLTSLLRSAMTQVSFYSLTDLLSAEPGGSKLGQLEADVLARLRDEKGGNVKQYGVEVVMVGISSLTLPKDVTAQVFERMGEARKRLAAKAESEGQAVATAIRSEAESAAKRIREFARFRADQIRNRGDLEAARYLTALKENEELATFLLGIEAMRQGMGRQATLVLPTSLFGFNLFTPEAMEKARRGEIPDVSGESMGMPPRPAASPSGEPAGGGVR